MPILPCPVTPYYGGGQVPNPANVIGTSGAPPSTLTPDKLGTMAVDNTAGNIYGLASKSGNVNTWVLLGGSTGAVASVLGTVNQITATTVGNVVTLSLPAAITTPGSLTTTTTLAAGTSLSAGTTITAGTGITATTGNITATNGNLVLSTAGNKVSIATGSNATVGTSGAMTAGAVVVANSSVTAASKIFAYPAALGTVTAPQAYYISAISAGVNFTITSQDGTDTSTWNYWIIN